ncbi:MAG: ubiquinone-dependent pyruvate dehydrogenase [Legionellaceae bacterium]|nr:ubiquinone-dependent pyruvate dehydrogenase [Legionellaceae bacterium]HAF87184.1 ubiquinone-dependent pyruvate dehydrogenase [Legionellales bacterium]HCA89522.1 ubiquinone-dependent pyruvate dehydrogenase [Legionellales bacterium]|tara:strand:- start:4441 stop:6174 length:1734 start_codon:yes stop_codon:yes gene_type:complete
MTPTTAEQTVQILKNAGIKRIYGVTGDSLNFLNDALRRDGNIQWIHVRHEEAGAYAAMAEGVLGGMGCCAGSSGPGHVHLINGLYDAHRWGAPVLALASTISSKDYGSESFQSTDLSMFDGCSYYNEIAQTPEQLPRMLQQAMQHAAACQGVGVCAFPGDLMMKKAYTKLPLATLYQSKALTRPTDDELDKLAVLLKSTKKIGIYAGLGCDNARENVLALAQKLNAPIAFTLKAKMAMEHDNAFAVGMTGLLGSSAGARAITECEVLLMLGSDFPWREFLDGRVKIIQIDTKPERLGRRVALYQGLTGSIDATLEALLPRLDLQEDASFLNTCLKEHQSITKRQQQHAQTPGKKNLISPEYLAHLVSELADDDAIFTADTGMCAVWAARYLKSTGKRHLMGSFSHGSMASAMPQAIGAAFYAPERQVIAFCGDGGLSMLLGDLMTISQYQLPIKLVVFNNRALGMVQLEMQVAGLPNWQTDMVNPHFADVARACGIKGIQVDDPALLNDALKEAFDSDEAVLIEVLTNPDIPVLPPHTSIGVLTRYVESEAKLAKAGRFKEAWLSLSTSVKYLRDLW